MNTGSNEQEAGGSNVQEANVNRVRTIARNEHVLNDNNQSILHNSRNFINGPPPGLTNEWPFNSLESIIICHHTKQSPKVDTYDPMAKNPTENKLKNVYRIISQKNDNVKNGACYMNDKGTVIFFDYYNHWITLFKSWWKICNVQDADNVPPEILQKMKTKYASFKIDIDGTLTRPFVIDEFQNLLFLDPKKYTLTVYKSWKLGKEEYWATGVFQKRIRAVRGQQSTISTDDRQIQESTITSTVSMDDSQPQESSATRVLSEAGSLDHPQQIQLVESSCDNDQQATLNQQLGQQQLQQQQDQTISSGDQYRNYHTVVQHPGIPTNTYQRQYIQNLPINLQNNALFLDPMYRVWLNNTYNANNLMRPTAQGSVSDRLGSSMLLGRNELRTNSTRVGIPRMYQEMSGLDRLQSSYGWNQNRIDRSN